MAKVGFLVSVIVAVGFQAIAQSIAIADLEEKLKKAQPDTTRIRLLNELSLAYLTNQPEKSIQRAKDALSLSEKIDFLTGEIVALNRMGENEFRRSNHANAVSFAMQSLKLAERQKDSLNIALAYRLLGLINTLGLKEYELALHYQLLALDIIKKQKDTRKLASLYGNISWIYASMNKNLTEAENMAKLGIHWADSLGDKQLLSYNYNSMGLIFFMQNKFDSSLWFIDRSIQMGEEAGDKAVVVYNQTIRGDIFYQLKEFKKAIDDFEKANHEGSLLTMAGMVKTANYGLAKSYAAIGEYKKAYQSHVLATRLTDSLQNWETIQKVLLIRLESEQEKQKEKIGLLERENKHARNEKIIISGVSVVALSALVAVIVLIALNNRQRAKVNNLLIEKNAEIAKQNAQLTEVNAIKDKFFSIIGHDLRSPLNSLKAMLGMVVKSEITTDEFKYFAPKLHQHVIGVGETLENLLLWSRSQMQEWTHSPTTVELKAIVDKVVGLFTETATVKKITLVNCIPETAIAYADENQLELIFRNLIHNAIKFTHEGGTVEIKALPNVDFVEVSVVDNGMGMTTEQASQIFKKSASTTRGTQGEKGTGLGLLLCKEMVENNGGKISVTSEVNKGSVFQVFLQTKPSA